jgi:hypothetical protein
MATRAALKPKLKVWIVVDGRVKFGDGRAELLERVEALGSLKQAVAGMGMSYRAAWGYLEADRESYQSLKERNTFLRARSPGDLPIEQPQSSSGSSTSNTATVLGLTLPRRCWRGRMRSSSRKADRGLCS